ncbi:hypothetical protein E4U28_006999 [Claviceps purpurea]|nr:hypothetical protein E4U28_006999 [Claviceps purpurea]
MGDESSIRCKRKKPGAGLSKLLLLHYAVVPGMRGRLDHVSDGFLVAKRSRSQAGYTRSGLVCFRESYRDPVVAGGLAYHYSGTAGKSSWVGRVGGRRQSERSAGCTSISNIAAYFPLMQYPQTP